MPGTDGGASIREVHDLLDASERRITGRLDERLDHLEAAIDGAVADHAARITRVETIQGDGLRRLTDAEKRIETVNNQLVVLAPLPTEMAKLAQSLERTTRAVDSLTATSNLHATMRRAVWGAVCTCFGGLGTYLLLAALHVS